MPETKIAAKTVKKEKRNKKRMEGLKRYFSEIKAEFNKIVWPTRNAVVRNTVVVVMSIFIVGIVIWCLDALTSLALSSFLKQY